MVECWCSDCRCVLVGGQGRGDGVCAVGHWASWAVVGSGRSGGGGFFGASLSLVHFLRMVIVSVKIKISQSA